MCNVYTDQVTRYLFLVIHFFLFSEEDEGMDFEGDGSFTVNTQ